MKIILRNGKYGRNVFVILFKISIILEKRMFENNNARIMDEIFLQRVSG